MNGRGKKQIEAAARRLDLENLYDRVAASNLNPADKAFMLQVVRALTLSAQPGEIGEQLALFAETTDFSGFVPRVSGQKKLF